jgi:hypothetical protein
MAGIVAAFIIGLAAGYCRYWFGYFVLGQGIIVGLTIPWLTGKFSSKRSLKQAVVSKPNTLIVVLLFFICFLMAQGVGFGLSQPWFDPIGWVVRTLSGRTSEHIFGISMLGGVASRSFHLGVKGGFWVFLNLFDLFFMVFFLLVGINTQ